MANVYRISVIGSGKVAWQLAQALENAGHYIEEIWSRKAENAARLVDHLYAAQLQQSLDFSKSRAEIFILSISDAAVPELVEQLMLPPDALLVHTSGTLSIEVLAPAANRYGVLYPLQTFSKERQVNFAELPFCVEASDKSSLKLLKKVAGSLSQNVQELDEPKRQLLHVAAVFASNFTNHLLRISEELLESGGLDQALLHPLVVETIQKGMELSPARAQTGPAIRDDRPVLAAHLQLLEQQPKWAELYYLLSEDIIRLHSEKQREREK